MFYFGLFIFIVLCIATIANAIKVDWFPLIIGIATCIYIGFTLWGVPGK